MNLAFGPITGDILAVQTLPFLALAADFWIVLDSWATSLLCLAAAFFTLKSAWAKSSAAAAVVLDKLQVYPLSIYCYHWLSSFCLGRVKTHCFQDESPSKLLNLSEQLFSQ